MLVLDVPLRTSNPQPHDCPRSRSPVLIRHEVVEQMRMLEWAPVPPHAYEDTNE